MDHLVLTVIADDQPGLVERLAKCIADHGGNWLESRMSRMAGQFAGILRVAVPADAHAELTAALEGLQAQGIRVLLAHSGAEPTASWQEIQRAGGQRPAGHRPRHHPPARRARRQSGEPGYRGAAGADEQRAAVSCRVRLAVPSDLSLERLQERLETLADDLMVELKLQPAEQA